MNLTPEMEALVEAVAEELWQAEHVRVRDKRRNVLWCEAGEQARAAWLPLARAIIPLIYTAGLRAGREEAATWLRERAAECHEQAKNPSRATRAQEDQHAAAITLDAAATSIRNLSEQEKSRG